jgi:multiple sugar transport system substrate-binding protein
MAPEVRPLNGLEPDEYFLAYPETSPQAAGVIISGPWVFCEAQRPQSAQEGSIGVALPPGASFVGGSNMVVWKYTRSPEAAVRLVRFLTRNSAQSRFAQTVGLLPARVETLESDPFSTDPFWQTAVRGMKTGRTFPTIRLWGLVEDRLTAGFSAVWNDVLDGMDPSDALARHLVPLARRLDTLLGQE